jgi:dipeptidyl aminopeptidase/acylaminoacyl peptidase
VSVSPDGNTVAYLKQLEDHRQVHIQPLHGGEGRPVADLPLGAAGVTWTPDGRLVALAALWSDQPTLDATRSRQPAPQLEVRSTEDAVYQYWDAWLEQVYHPVVIDPADGSIFDLTPGATRFWSWPATDEPIADLDVSPDGSMLAICADDSEPPHRELSWSLFLVSLEGGTPTRLDTDRRGHSRRPRFTRDGASIVYGYQTEPDYYACLTELTLYDIATGEHRPLTARWDRSPSRWVLSGKDTLLFTAEDESRSRLWRLGMADGGVPERLTDEGWVSDPTVSPDGTVHALAHDLTTPPEIHQVAGPGRGRSRHPVTSFTSTALADTPMGRAREVTIPGAEGDPVQTWLVDPPETNSDQPLPLVHMLHGGPHAVSGDAWHWRWNAQVVAAAGYRVAMVNFHGSTGWGDAFASSIHGAWGDLPLRDVEAVTDHLIERGWADDDRVAVTGGSYGGYLVAWITSQTDRYAGAVAHAAVTDLPGMYASDLTYGRARAYGSEIWEDPGAVERWSPASQAAGYTTPTLVIHGEKDRRVPATQGLELYGVLVAKGVPARLLVYPGENHWILSRTNSVHWYEEFIGWLKRWL